MNREIIQKQLNTPLEGTDFPSLGTKYAGKVRDVYRHRSKSGDQGEQMYIITTDRISAFDRVLGTVPFKGQLLTEMAMFWFKETQDIMRNHVIANPDPNVMKVRSCEPVKVEMVVRGYLTGASSTSVWTHYKNGRREYCGVRLPEGMRKDQRFATPIVTPTTKAEQGEHDSPISPAEIVAQGLLTKAEYEELESVSLALFARGTEIAAGQGIILVDTKYEFGKYQDRFMLIDEIHTPDSSRFWHADTYDECFEQGKEQQKIDKEYVRVWLEQQGFTGDGAPPPIPDEVKVETTERYIEAYEKITGRRFAAEGGDALARIKKNLDIS